MKNVEFRAIVPFVFHLAGASAAIETATLATAASAQLGK
jgi:hypothetical protein